MERSELLKKITLNAVEDIKTDFMSGLSKNVEIFKENGIVSNMHYGCKPEEMVQDTEESKVLKLEHFAGILISLYEKKKYPMIKSLICCTIKDVCK